VIEVDSEQKKRLETFLIALLCTLAFLQTVYLIENWGFRNQMDCIIFMGTLIGLMVSIIVCYNNYSDYKILKNNLDQKDE
jgi:hypothetical protein